MEGTNPRVEILLGDVLYQVAADGEWPAGECHFHFAFRLDLGDAVAEEADDMCWIEWRVNRHHGLRFGNAVRGCEHRSTAEAVANKHNGRGEHPPEMIGGGNQIVDIRRECGVGKFTFTGAEASEIKAQHRNALSFQTFGDAARRRVVLTAGEAMRE